MASKKMPPWLNKKGEEPDEDEKKSGKSDSDEDDKKKKMTPAERLKMFRENRKKFSKK